MRWLIPAALLALTPKCLLCVFAYVSVGTALGRGVPEICGATGASPATWASSLAWLGGAIGLAAAGAHVIGTCRRRTALRIQ